MRFFCCITYIAPLVSLQLVYKEIHHPEYQPARAGDLKVLQGVDFTIRYKEPSKYSLCKTASNVRSFFGIVEVEDYSHVFVRLF
jgi:hypothetical protein